MMRKLTLTSICLSFLVASPVRAGDAMRDAIASLPEDAVAFACVPNLKQLDDSFQQVVNDLGLQAFLPPPTNSAVGMIKQYLPMLAGLDENGPLAVVLMPADNMGDLWQKLVFIASASDPKGMIEGMGGQPGEGGVWTINLFGRPAFAAIGEKRVILTQTADLAKKVASSKGGLDRKIQPGILKTMEGLDKAVWIDADHLLKLFKDQINALVGMMGMMQAAGGPLGATQAEATKQQVDMIVEGASSICFGVSLKKPGLGFRFGMSAKPGSEMARQIKVVPTKESLLRGLPADKFLLAIGQVMDPAQLRASMKSLDPYLEMLDAVEGLDKEQIGQLKSMVREWLPMFTGVRMLVQPIAPGPNGLFGVSIIMDTSSSKRWLELARKAVETGKKLLTDASAELIDEDVKKVVDAIAYKLGAEEINGAKINHLTFDLSKIDTVDEEELEQVQKVIGKDGILFRVAGIDDHRIVVGFGGGADYMGRLIESARKKGDGKDNLRSGLDDDPGIKKVAANLTSERASVAYISVDQIIGAINSVAKALDEEELPIKMPAINAPLAMSGTGGNGWQRFDIFVPMELMVAVKNATLAMMGGGQVAPPSTSALPAPGGG